MQNCWSYGSSIFSILRNMCIALHSVHINLHSNQQCKRAPFSSFSLQHLLLVDFLVIAILNGVKWCCFSVEQSCLTPCNPMNCGHTRPHCPSLSPGLFSNTCPLSHWCQSAILSSVTPYSSCSQSSPKSKLFTSSGQNIGVTASASIIPMNTQGWFPLGLTGFISLLSKRLSRVFSSTRVRKLSFFSAQPSSCSKSHIHTWLLGQP